jgi:hypothetical protein
MTGKPNPAALRREAEQRASLFLAIGEFIFEFSQLEFTIRHALGTALDLNDDTRFDAVTSPYDFAALCRVTSAILQQMCTRGHGWHIVAAYEDAGVSGAKGRDERPGFDGLMMAVARREIDMVAAWSVDRLGRSLTDLLGFLTDLHAKGVDLFLHQQGLDTSTPSGRAMFQMFRGVRARDDPRAGHDRPCSGSRGRQATRSPDGRAEPRGQGEGRAEAALTGHWHSADRAGSRSWGRDCDATGRQRERSAPFWGRTVMRLVGSENAAHPS